ncbi:MAG: sulfatase-like hydrolase/transferase [Planctomycetes bacterium]|nr:sulfatase-like hydrolase/transferase [Planctomycetota bacterium]
MKNILLILTDQQRKDSLGSYGNTICKTPNLDRIAESGVRFNRNYVANPICMPNRACILTGQNLRNHGLWTNGLLLDEFRTVANELSEQGYQTASFGKIHLQPFGGDHDHPEAAVHWKDKSNAYDWTGPYFGFEHVELTISHTSRIAHYGQWFREHGGTEEMGRLDTLTGAPQSGTRPMPSELHDSAFVGDRVSAFLKDERDRSKPFFCVASFPDPHHPFNPPEDAAKDYPHDNVTMPTGSAEDLASRPAHYAQHFRGEWHRKGMHDSKHPEGLSEEHTRERIAHTYAMVDLIDRNVGKILDALESEGLRENTVVIFTSDHGELLGDHGLWFKGPFFYEGLISTPLIISAPGEVAPGVSENLSSAIDLVPTMCDLAGASAPYYADGISLAPHLRDSKCETRKQALVEYHNGYGAADSPSKVLITERWKYVQYANGDAELTDLQNDPEERVNLAGAGEYAPVVQEMKGRMLEEILATSKKNPEQISHA